MKRIETLSPGARERFENASKRSTISFAILPATEKQGESPQLRGWQDMARRRYQTGSIRKRGKRKPIWELQWWADHLTADGRIGRKRESMILGYVSDLSKKQAHKLAAEHLQPLNQGKLTPLATITFNEFIERSFVPLALPNLKQSTRKRYMGTLSYHLQPAFGSRRLCDISTVELQAYVLKKFDSGSGWEVCNHLRNLMSKVFECAKKWSQFNGDNPASGVELPEKLPVRSKGALSPDQCQSLLNVLPEPVRTMALVGILAGLRVGEILGLRWQDVCFLSKNIRIEQAAYRGSIGSPKTKGSQTYPSHARAAPRRLSAPPYGIGGTERACLSHTHRGSAQRFDAPLPVHQTGGAENRRAGPQLAHVSAHACNVALAVRRFPQGSPGTARALAHCHHDGHLHAQHPVTAAEGCRENG